MNRLSYYTNPEYNELKTSLLSAEECAEGWLLELKDTLFYPEGGGQPADGGTINGIPLIHVKKSEGRVLHLCAGKPEGDVMNLKLDREKRDHFCIQHTAQHLISSLLLSLWDAPTVSVHLGQEESTIEIDSDKLTEDQLFAVEEAANREIRACRQVKSILVASAEELAQYSLRRSTDKTENIRLVEIEGLDITPCGGLHTDNTARLGLIKYTGQEKIRGRLRLKWKMGAPAYADYRMRFSQLEAISSLLSEQPGGATRRLREVLEEKKEANRLLRVLTDKQAELISRQLSGSVTHYPPVLIRELADCPSDLFRGIVKNLSTRGDLSFLLCARDEGRLNWALCLPGGDTIDFNTFQSDCLPLIQGKGGGRAPLWQGSGGDGSGAEAFLESFRVLAGI
ncbi:MAG: hypothetical protein PQJ58_02825 [Spirochaetales bacterium]|nr:hypothetical protein [Spirochaetales bacterium]